MNLRKSFYFKPLCLLVAALFAGQCMSIKRELISTEEKVIESESQGYVYELVKVKTPSVQDPTVEYRIVKFPANRVQSINVYKKVRKADPLGCVLGGLVVGAVIGAAIGALTAGKNDDRKQFENGFYGFFIGAITGGISGPKIGEKIGIKRAIRGEIKEPAGYYLKKKPDSIPIPAQNLPLELKWGTRGKSYSFKTQTDEQGFVRINLIDNLKMTKFLPDRPLILFIHYFNPGLQKIERFIDSQGPLK
ncbi:MAG: hypothetical protein NT166_12370 [Candidatus Aminicenantes bacterium]|nr:hypothetical protein [Candidatus Aminicenantes bacterium]